MILLDKDLPKEPAEIASVSEAIEIIDKLEYELAHSKILGIGLASPQIGINKAVAIIRIKNPYNDPSEPVLAINLVNPIILEGNDLITYEEGCLSFPGKFVKTIRYGEIVIETNDWYEDYAYKLNVGRYGLTNEKKFVVSSNRRKIQLGKADEADDIGELICVAVQHEHSHLLALNFNDFRPQEVGRNDKCPCGSGTKNKKCCNVEKFNNNLLRLFKPNYRGEK